MAARVLVGLAGAGLIVMAFSVVTAMFSQKGTAQGGRDDGGGHVLGLPDRAHPGGWLLTNYWWGWVFLINVPVIALGLAAVVALVRESARPNAQPGPGRGGSVGCRAGGSHLRADQGWPGRMGQPRRAGL